MKVRVVDAEISLIPYYPNEAKALPWYQDKTVCKQVDNLDQVYTLERLRAMYDFLSSHGMCYYIAYCGRLVGDVTLQDNGEVSIVICREYQNRHIGRRCILAMIGLAEERGMTQIRANVYSFNTQSQRMFFRAGFTQMEPEWLVYTLQQGKKGDCKSCRSSV